jgi:hypothetical protein
MPHTSTRGKAEPFLEGGVELGLDARAETEADLMLPLLRRGGLVEEQGRHHAQIVDGGGPRRHHVRPPAPRAESLRQDETAGGQDDAHARHPQTVHVKER